MSKFLQILKGAAKSNTVQINALLAIIWTAVLNSDMIQSNPDYAAILGGISALINVILRFKTSKPLADR